MKALQMPIERYLKLCIIFLFLCISIMANSRIIFAESDKQTVIGRVYELDKNSDYGFADSDQFTASDKKEPYGSFSVAGDIGNISEKNGVPSYEIISGNMDIYYTYGDVMLSARDEEWHLIDDKGKNIDGTELDDKILKGAIIVQISMDGKNWTNLECMTNVFSEEPVKTDKLCSTTDVQILNGCYYRVIVAYKIERIVNTDKILFVPVKNCEYKKIVEVYEFYAYIPSTDSSKPSVEQTYALGNKVRVKEFDGYSGQTEIDKKDIHYGWDLGQFFVSGYTNKTKDSDGNIVFLKNVGDKVTLWFNLEQDINKLNGDKKLTITSDDAGYDQYFETPRMKLGKGTLIVRYTNYNNKRTDPQIYTNYLEANASVGADTKVELFEEGDYEVALDYEVTSDKIIDKVGHYRIFFTYSVRNGNCMVYPLDVSTGSELTNSSMTENGFVLDMAKSRYLQINVKREILSDSTEGLVEDTRSNAPAKDGEKYTDEGIYTITVTNQYTNQTTTKKIYVGTNKVLKAYMTSGLPIEEINRLVFEGAIIDDDGVMTMPAVQTSQERSSNNQVKSQNTLETNIPDNSGVVKWKIYKCYLLALGIVIILIILFHVVKMRKKKVGIKGDTIQ